MPPLSWLNPDGARDRATENPLGLAKFAIGAILLLATVVALLLAVTGVVPRALQVALACWAIYGLAVGLLDGVLEPVIEGVGRLMADVGLRRVGGGSSAIETLVARGYHEAAAEAYRERAQEPRSRVEATLRRAALLAGPLGHPETAATELESLRRGDVRLRPEEDIRVGLALAELWERRLADPGRAMVELRRLLDTYPSARRMRQIRAALAALKRERFGE